MSRATKIMIGFALASLGMLIPAAGAQAEVDPAGDTAVCTVTGHASLDTGGPIPYVLSPGATHGTYTFNSLTFDCGLAGPLEGIGQEAQPGSYSVTSNGVYNNTGPNCGTGTADATAANTIATGQAHTLANGVTIPAGPEGPIKVGYHIDFNGGQGVLTVQDGGSFTDPNTVPPSTVNYGNVSHSDGTGGSGGGPINITPTGGVVPPGGLGDACATGFDVNGTVVLNLSDTA